MPKHPALHGHVLIQNVENIYIYRRNVSIYVTLEEGEAFERSWDFCLNASLQGICGWPEESLNIITIVFESPLKWP